MQYMASDAVELDGAQETFVEVDLLSSLPDGIDLYVVTYVDVTGGDPCAWSPPGSLSDDPLKLGDRPQVYPQTAGPWHRRDGNPHLVIGAAGAATVAYTAYALTDGAADYGR